MTKFKLLLHVLVFVVVVAPQPLLLTDNLKMAPLEIFHVSRKAPGTSEDM